MDNNIIWHIINAKQAWRKRNVRVGMDYHFSIFNYSNIISRSSSKVSHRNLDLRIVQKLLLTEIYSTFLNSSFCRWRGLNRKISSLSSYNFRLCHHWWPQIVNVTRNKSRINSNKKYIYQTWGNYQGFRLCYQFLFNLTKQICFYSMTIHVFLK